MALYEYRKYKLCCCEKYTKIVLGPYFLASMDIEISWKSHEDGDEGFAIHLHLHAPTRNARVDIWTIFYIYPAINRHMPGVHPLGP